MKYSITRTRKMTGKSQVLEYGQFKSESDASIWFTDYVADMLAEDVTGHYRYESYLQSTDGRYLNESTEEVVDSLPSWWQGEGFYDESDNLVLKYASPRDGSFPEITSFDDGDYVYRLESDPVLTTNEVMAMLRLSKPTIFKMIKEGKLNPEKVGNKYLFSKAEITDMLP